VNGRRDVCCDVDPIIGVDGVCGRVVRHGCESTQRRLRFEVCVSSKSASIFEYQMQADCELQA
jgi:hypothetical protein